MFLFMDWLANFKKHCIYKHVSLCGLIFFFKDTLDKHVSLWSIGFKGLKATRKRQDNGTGVLHQIAQHPIHQISLYTRCPCPSPPMQDLERQSSGCRAGKPMHPSKPRQPLLKVAVETFGQWKFYRCLERSVERERSKSEADTLPLHHRIPFFNSLLGIFI